MPPFSIPVAYRRLVPLLLLPFGFWFLLNRVDNASSSSSIPVDALIRLAEADLSRSQLAYINDLEGLDKDRSELGLKLEGGIEELGLAGYRRRIENALEHDFGWDGRIPRSVSFIPPSADSFDPPPIEPTSPPNFLSSLNHLSLSISPSISPHTRAPRQLPKRIYTTHHKPDFPSQFSGWKSLNPDYELSFLNDTALDVWVADTFEGTAMAEEWIRLGEYVEQAREGEQKLKRRRMCGALRADLFRYLVIMNRGGIWTDVDAVSVRKIEEWGTTDLMRLTPTYLEMIPTILALQNPLIAPTSLSADLPPPSLIIAVEHDSPKEGSDWKGLSMSRGIQMVQWTFAGHAGHPIFVDAVSQALETTRNFLAQVNSTNFKTPDVLEWTGPGLWTDCIFRYLLARYGIRPRQLSGYKQPLRVGDVLILPARAFQADISEKASGSQDAVWHGFLGQWRGS